MDGLTDDVASLRRGMSELERQLEAVRRIAVRLSTATETDELVREALDTSLVLAQSEAGSILLYNSDKQKLVFEYVVGEKADELTNLELEPDQGLAGQVFQSARTLVSDDVAAETAHLREVGEKVGYVTRNMVTVPLMSPEGEPLGVMQVLNKRGAHFDQYDVRLIEIIAAQVAVAVETVRLHEQARLATVVRFIGNISHDVKNMITPAMVGAQTLEMIANDCFTKFDECLGRQVQLGDRASDLAATLTKLRQLYPEIAEMILEGCEVVQQRMAQIAAAVKGRVSEPHFEPTEIVSIAQRVGVMLSPQAQRKGVTLTIEGVPDLPPATVDGKQIYNAVYNLILNAIDACDDGDAVALRCDAVVEGEFPSGNCIVVECADTGPGIPEEVKHKLFTDQAVSTKAMGTGLGTRIVKDVVEAHDGTLELESEVGVGTTIRCRIPLQRESDGPNVRS
ncbi:MAG: GAF domain-containing sensor histidine kinase [Armatimonadetes bacterium]|nr:GAF domain-containing sensor histidine kinase [Armatimonadota bacterium]